MSVYRVTEVIGISEESWEDAAREAVKTAAGTVASGPGKAKFAGK